MAGGSGYVEQLDGEPNALRLSARVLAALYAGRPMTALRRAGLAEGEERHDEVADTIFATSVPYLTDYF